MDIKTLQQAQNSNKKHKKLEEEVKNHSVVVDKVVDCGARLYNSPEYSQIVQENSTKLTETWAELLSAIQIKAGQLKLILTAQQFFFEVAEVESWIKDKISGMKAAEFGKDEDSSVKLLTKHKAVELEVDTYSGIVQEISATATKLTNNNHPDCKQIKSRDEMLSRELKNLKNISKVRRDRLVEVDMINIIIITLYITISKAIEAHVYKRESDEFRAWIGKQ